MNATTTDGGLGSTISSYIVNCSTSDSSGGVEAGVSLDSTGTSYNAGGSQEFPYFGEGTCPVPVAAEYDLSVSAYGGATGTESESVDAATFTIFLASTIAITTTLPGYPSRLPDASVSQPYAFCGGYTVSGGYPPYTWSVIPPSPGLSNGPLPPGLALSSSDGSISGTPTEAGQFDFELEADDRYGAGTFIPLMLSISASSGQTNAPMQCTSALHVSLVDPAPQFVTSSAVISDINGLATSTKVVTGAAADGVTQLIVRILGVNANDSVQLSLRDENDAADSRNGCLAKLGDSQCSDTVNLHVDSSTAGSVAFAAYHAPPDFVRSNVSSDSTASSRELVLKLTDSSSTTTSSSSTTPINFRLVRPPVLYIHGLWSSAGTWDDFDSALRALIPGIRTYRIDYKSTNYMGVDFNAPKVLDQLILRRGQFRSEMNVAAVQFDVVTHSMGGLIAKDMLSPALKGRSMSTSATYGHGYIHKLIAIDTPWIGSRLASLLGSSNVTCQKIFNDAGRRIGGAITDLSPGSHLLNVELPAIALPRTHAVAGVSSSSQEVVASEFINDLLNPAPPLGQQLTTPLVCSNLFVQAPLPFTFNAIFNDASFNGANDLIVSQESQESGFTPGITADLTQDVVHFNTGFLSRLGLTGALNSASQNPSKVKDLLNRPIADSQFAGAVQ